MTAPARRNACPTIAQPMETGDGLLARLPPAPPLPAARMAALADCARRYGNGLVEVSARGSIQVRGLSAATVEPFAARLAAAGIADARPAIHVPPLAGLEPGGSDDAPALADALRAALDASGIGRRLAAKASIAIDGPGTLHLDALDADLRLTVHGGEVLLALGGTAATARPVGIVGRDRAIEAAQTALAMLARLGPAARGRDLDPAAVATATAAVVGARPASRPGACPIGLHPLRDGGVAVGLGLTFGCADAAMLEALLAAATTAGATHFAPAADRTLLAIGIAPGNAAGFRSAAHRLGFIVEAGDPRRAIAACAGAPACASARMPARGIAETVARAAASVLDGSVTLHLSGCAKGCAHPGAATLALVGTDAGLALAVAGRADAAVPTGLGVGEAVDAVARLAQVLDAGRRTGETAADTIHRLGAQPLVAALARETADA